MTDEKSKLYCTKLMLTHAKDFYKCAVVATQPSKVDSAMLKIIYQDTIYYTGAWLEFINDGKLCWAELYDHPTAEEIKGWTDLVKYFSRECEIDMGKIFKTELAVYLCPGCTPADGKVEFRFKLSFIDYDQDELKFARFIISEEIMEALDICLLESEKH